eukprot:GHVS01079278.1.p1 GENE.GHVS01079278.1~~GHVS01079278.1.p1  ORF type:complete len:1149 (+),score=221.61 GHVS01079278.1:98-3448(+)
MSSLGVGGGDHHRGELSVLLREAVKSHIHSFKVKDLVQLATAYARLKFRDETMWTLLAHRCLQQVQFMDGVAIAQILNGFAKAGWIHLDMTDRCAERLLVVARTCDFNSIALILRAYARFRTRCTYSVFDCVAQQIPRCTWSKDTSIPRSDHLHVSTSVVSSATTNQTPPPLPPRGLAPISCSLVLRAFADMLYFDHALYAPLLDWASAEAPSFAPRHLAAVCLALQRLQAAGGRRVYVSEDGGGWRWREMEESCHREISRVGTEGVNQWKPAADEGKKRKIGMVDSWRDMKQCWLKELQQCKAVATTAVDTTAVVLSEEGAVEITKTTTTDEEKRGQPSEVIGVRRENGWRKKKKRITSAKSETKEVLSVVCSVIPISKAPNVALKEKVVGSVTTGELARWWTSLSAAMQSSLATPSTLGGAAETREVAKWSGMEGSWNERELVEVFATLAKCGRFDAYLLRALCSYLTHPDGPSFCGDWSCWSFLSVLRSFAVLNVHEPRCVRALLGGLHRNSWELSGPGVSEAALVEWHLTGDLSDSMLRRLDDILDIQQRPRSWTLPSPATSKQPRGAIVDLDECFEDEEDLHHDTAAAEPVTGGGVVDLLLALVMPHVKTEQKMYRMDSETTMSEERSVDSHSWYYRWTYTPQTSSTVPVSICQSFSFDKQRCRDTLRDRLRILDKVIDKAAVELLAMETQRCLTTGVLYRSATALTALKLLYAKGFRRFLQTLSRTQLPSSTREDSRRAAVLRMVSYLLPREQTVPPPSPPPPPARPFRFARVIHAGTLAALPGPPPVAAVAAESPVMAGRPHAITSTDAAFGRWLESLPAPVNPCSSTSSPSVVRARDNLREALLFLGVRDVVMGDEEGAITVDVSIGEVERRRAENNLKEEPLGTSKDLCRGVRVEHWRDDGPPPPVQVSSDTSARHVKRVVGSCRVAVIFEPREFRRTTIDATDQSSEEDSIVVDPWMAAQCKVLSVRRSKWLVVSVPCEAFDISAYHLNQLNQRNVSLIELHASSSSSSSSSSSASSSASIGTHDEVEWSAELELRDSCVKKKRSHRAIARRHRRSDMSDGSVTDDLGEFVRNVREGDVPESEAQAEYRRRASSFLAAVSHWVQQS